MSALTRLRKELSAPNADAKRIVKGVNKLCDDIDSVRRSVTNFRDKEKTTIQAIDKKYALNMEDSLKDALVSLKKATDHLVKGLFDLDDLVDLDSH
jgi:hypothetical protein